MTKLKQIALLSFAVGLISAAAYIFKEHQNLLPNKEADSTCEDCNVILVSLDTLSAKHLPCYGYERQTAPNLCEYAAKNILFEYSYASGTWTLPSTTSIFTGLYPSSHQVFTYSHRLDTNHPLLPKILRNNGYKTIFQMPQHDQTLGTDTVLNGSVDEFINYSQNWSKTVDYLAQFNKSGDKFFAFLHTYEVHDPYFIGDEEPVFTTDKIDNIPLSLEEFYKVDTGLIEFLKTEMPKRIGDETSLLFSDQERARKILETIEGDHNSALKTIDQHKGLLWWYFYNYNYLRNIDQHDDRHTDYLKALYDQKILQLDKDLGTFFKSLAKSGLDENTIVVITSDHGEEFMEHGFLSHVTLYEGNIRTPLIMSVPGVDNLVIKEKVQGVDIVPTLLDMLNISSSYDFDGQSVAEVINNPTVDEERLVYSDGIMLKSKMIVWKKWKLILSKENDDSIYTPTELYDFIADPDESNNLIFNYPEIVSEILRSY